MQIRRGVVSPDGEWIGVRVACWPVAITCYAPRYHWDRYVEAECEVKARDMMVRRGFKEASFDT